MQIKENKNGLQAIAVVPAEEYKPNKNIMKISSIHSVEQSLGNLMETYLQTHFRFQLG